MHFDEAREAGDFLLHGRQAVTDWQPGTVIPIGPQELVELTGGVVADLRVEE